VSFHTPSRFTHYPDKDQDQAPDSDSDQAPNSDQNQDQALDPDPNPWIPIINFRRWVV